MIALTGANGQLGTLVIQELVKRYPAQQIVAGVRDTTKAKQLAAVGVQLREADYDRSETLERAFQGVDKVLVISAVVPGQRLRQHQAVIDAALKVGVSFLAYTSILKADTSTLGLAEEHRQTESAIKASGLKYVLLRNGWYLENHTAAVPMAVQHDELTGSSGDGRFASGSRADYAEAAAVVLAGDGHDNKTYELAGDHSFNMEELAQEISRQIGRTVPYKNLSSDAYRAALLGLGLPSMLVDVAVDADSKAQQGQLDSDSTDLSKLIGRPTTTLAQAVTAALQSRST